MYRWTQITIKRNFQLRREKVTRLIYVFVKEVALNCQRSWIDQHAKGHIMIELYVPAIMIIVQSLL